MTFSAVLAGSICFFLKLGGPMRIWSSVGALLQWVNLVFRIRCFSTTGPFIRITIVTVYECRWLMMLLMIYWIGFAQSFYLVFNKLAPNDNEMYHSLPNALYWVFYCTLGDIPDTLE